MAPPNHIDAPYNFVPLANWVHIPEWATRVSHDLPFRDGLSGHLDLKITAHTPILVGREQQKSTADAPGEVYPYQLPDGCYALPGTALKGMIRSVVEIASFSRMSLVDDQRLGVRDLTPAARSFYGNYMTKSVGAQTYQALSKAGWLFFDATQGRWFIKPCQYARVEQSRLDSYCGNAWFECNKSNRLNAQQKYDHWRSTHPLTIAFDPGPVSPHPHSQGKRLVYSMASNLGVGRTQGTLVFTGQPSARKHLEFIFYDSPAVAMPIQVSDQVFRGFLDIHDQKTESTARTVWDDWRNEPHVPVFYLEKPGNAGTVASLGLAQMYKLAYRHSIHEAICHSNPKHLDGGGDDLGTLLFGRVGDTSEGCLKGRVTINHAMAEGKPQPLPQNPTILNGPKATYYPNYIRQSRAANNRIPNGQSYVTLMDSDCQIRGWKRYPARPLAAVQALTADQIQNTNVQVILHPLPAGTVFNTRLVFHNLKPEELGALCWALTWGGVPGLRHSLGMGKPFGFGQIGIGILAAELHPNSPESAPLTWDECRDRFISVMEKAAHEQRVIWHRSPQIEALLGMADPVKTPVGALSHMRLTTDQNNQFKDAKTALLVLADYPRGTHPSLPPPPPPPRIVWDGVEMKLNPGNGELSVFHKGMNAIICNPYAQVLRDALPDEIKARLKNKKTLKNCSVSVEAAGRGWKLREILAVGDVVMSPAPSCE